MTKLIIKKGWETEWANPKLYQCVELSNKLKDELQLYQVAKIRIICSSWNTL